MNTKKSSRRLSIEEQIARLGPAVRARELRMAGVSARQIFAAMEAGRVLRVARGYYALPGLSELEKFLAENQAQLACLSRLKGLGLWVLHDPAQLHVATGHGRRIPGCTVHKVPGEETLLGVVRQAVRCGTELDALITMESAVVTNQCTIDQLRTEFDRRSDTRARRIIKMLDPQSMSITETAGRFQLLMAGHNVVGQAYIREIGHTDLLVDGILGIEADGQKFHNTAQAWREDLHRDAMYVLNGLWRLRLPADLILYQPLLFLNYVERALARIRSAQRSAH